MTILDGDDVIMVLQLQREGDSIQEEILNHMRIRKLRYINKRQQYLRKQNLVNSNMIYF